MAISTKEIWQTLLKHMPRGGWVDIQEIYKIVEDNLTLDDDDLDRVPPAFVDLRWKRNVRNVLQKRKSTDIEWNGDAKYRLPTIESKLSRILKLNMLSTYSRKDVHSIFSPDTTFTPQAGTWGLHGIIAVPNSPGDFVFFVTLGQQQGDHKFDEGITADGVISWQSQPKQSLKDKQIHQLINHDELKNNIYLFFRTSKDRDYTYLGLLKYLSHDSERQYPVYFQWQILDWDLDNLPEYITSILQGQAEAVVSNYPKVQNSLEMVEPPQRMKKVGVTTPAFKAKKETDFPGRDARNKTLGLQGELLVMELEKETLIKYGKPELAEKVRHISQILGDGVGYDIESFTSTGDIKYIEVKTTKGSKSTSFYMSSNEKAFSNINKANYYLYRVFEYDESSNSGKYFILTGDLEKELSFSPTQFRVSFVFDELPES